MSMFLWGIVTNYSHELKGILIGYVSSTVEYRVCCSGTTEIEETKQVKIVEGNLHFTTSKNEINKMVKFNIFKNDAKNQEKEHVSSLVTFVKGWKWVEKVRQRGKTASMVEIYC